MIDGCGIELDIYVDELNYFCFMVMFVILDIIFNYVMKYVWEYSMLLDVYIWNLIDVEYGDFV